MEKRVHLMVPRQLGKGALAEEITELLVQDDRLLERLGKRAAAISNWLDQELAKGDRSEEAIHWQRTAKCSEEAGEVIDAMIAVTGGNPRKGVSGTWDDVKDELLDVALTALGAYEHLSGARGESAYALLNHAETRMDRVGLSLDG